MIISSAVMGFPFYLKSIKTVVLRNDKLAAFGSLIN
jgi:hypothetical protein